jgi:carboxymethylenebutenolidase
MTLLPTVTRRARLASTRRARLAPPARRAALVLTLLAASGVAGVPLAPPAAAAPPGKGEMVTFGVGDEKVQAFLSWPAGDGGRPGVIVIHEWWGLNDQIKGVTNRLARLGYVAIAPDFYRGKVTTDRGYAHEYMRGLIETRAVEIIKGAAAHLRTLGGARDRRVATLGFCMGGRLSLAAALKGADLQAAVMFYGSVETTPEAVKPLACPLLGIFGKEDGGIPVEEVKKFEAALKATGKTAEIEIYPTVGHAFFNENSPSYVEHLAEKAWDRTKAFLATHLDQPSGPAGVGAAPARPADESAPAKPSPGR